MIDIAFLDDLLRRMRAAGLSELEIEQDGVRVFMGMGGMGQPAPPKAEPTQTKIRAEGIGTFLPSHPRRPGTTLRSGDKVSSGMVLGYLAFGPTLTAIVSPIAGTLSEILVEDGTLVGFGEHVFTIEAEA